VSQHPKRADLESLLATLCEAGIEFIVVGGVAAVLQGAPITTQDLDIVHQRTPENITRLVALLNDLDAFFRPVLSGRYVRPTSEHLAGNGHVNLTTRLGPLDHLCLMDGRSYEDLLPHTDELTDGSLQLRVLDLPTLIETKKRTGRAKDQLSLPILIALMAKRGPL
jgi:hypothetical protein